MDYNSSSRDTKLIKETWNLMILDDLGFKYKLGFYNLNQQQRQVKIGSHSNT